MTDVIYPTRVPQFLCPKCGANCDVKWMQARTQEALDEFERNTRGLVQTNYHTEKRHMLRQGILHGEHLDVHCDRCGWGGISPVVEPDPLTMPVFTGSRS